MSAPARVAFLGVGAIGLPMAVRMSRSGAEVTAVDTAPERQDLARAAGLKAVATLAEAADVRCVVVMVATPDQARVAVAGPAGVLDLVEPGSDCVVMSTVGPGVVAELSELARARGVTLVDAPVTGGVSGAERGRLTVFASGDAGALARVEPLLGSLGRVHRCGTEPGRGQSVKLVNQLLCSVHLAAAAEALALGERMGLDPGEVLAAVREGAGGSWMLADRGPRMLGQETSTASALDIFVKDSALVVGAAQEAGFPAPLAAAARDRFRAAARLGLGRRDDSRVIDVYRD